jgi:hypothetical protein
MSRALTTVLGVWLAVAPVVGRAQDEGSPHHMTKPDGSLDMEKCGACHNEDLSLQRSKLETCTLCHAQTVHAGAAEHLRADPAAVKRVLVARALAGQAEGAPALPLGDDGHIYCGTCHLFHDPKVTGEDWLKEGWLPRDSDLPGAVRQGVVDRWAALAAQSEDKTPVGRLATKGTRQLRLPVGDGQLCRRCHGVLR